MEVVVHSQRQTESATRNTLEVAVNNTTSETSGGAFIEANTVAATLLEIRQDHIIPVFLKDNEPVISQVDFIELTSEAVHSCFPSERILSPTIRLSHPIKGRVPEAKDKPAIELQEWEKTIYFERMAFMIEVPSICDTIDGQRLSLTIGGIKSYSVDNLYNKSGADQHFKIFIGFKVHVCTNLCVWSDGAVLDLKVKSAKHLQFAIMQLIQGFEAVEGLTSLSRLQGYQLSEKQFAHLIGRCRMYSHLPQNFKADVPELHFNDTQVNAVCRDYYRDKSFCRMEDGQISLWRLYNLFTAANKSSYIDSFVDRAVGATSFVSELAGAMEKGSRNWFLA